MTERKLTHFIPASGDDLAVFAVPDSSGREESHRIEAWGLFDDGSTAALVSTAEGTLLPADDDEHFLRVEGTVHRG